MDFNGMRDKLLSKLGQTADTAKDFADKAGDSVKDLANKAADKAKAGGRIAKLTMEISTEKETMKKAYLEIGRLYYDTHKDAPDGFFIQLCEEIGAAEQKIAEKEAEIAALKEELGGKAEPDVSVEFEEVVEQDESSFAEKAEDVVEAVADKAEDIYEAVKDKVEDAYEDVKDAIEETFED